jgi:hypothetical protein
MGEMGLMGRMRGRMVAVNGVPIATGEDREAEIRKRSSAGGCERRVGDNAPYLRTIFSF